METTLNYNIPLSVNELADLIRDKFPRKERLKLVKLLQKEPTEEAYEEPTKEQLMEEIREAVREVNLAKQGKMKSRPIQELLDEL